MARARARWGGMQASAAAPPVPVLPRNAPEGRRVTFLHYVVCQQYRRDLGQGARELLWTGVPRRTTSAARWRRHLESRGASPTAWAAFEQLDAEHESHVAECRERQAQMRQSMRREQR
jgi:hypothetical protein